MTYKLVSATIGLFMFLLFGGCDAEKFVGYNYDAEQLAKSADITGQITNIFTNEPVVEANVNVVGQTATTNQAGEYFLDYIFRGDEELDKMIPVTISAEKYYAIDTTIIIYPSNNQLNIKLVYGAPLILESERTDTTECCIIIRAVIFDYQGISDIDSVFAHVWYYWDNGINDNVDEVRTLMSRTATIDEYSAEFRCEIPIQTVIQDGIGSLIPAGRHKIVVNDKSGFNETTYFFY